MTRLVSQLTAEDIFDFDKDVMDSLRTNRANLLQRREGEGFCQLVE